MMDEYPVSAPILPPRFRLGRLIQVIEVHVVEGTDTMLDYMREVIYYLQPQSGILLAKHDPLDDWPNDSVPPAHERAPP